MFLEQGAVIIRLSWNKKQPIKWDDSVSLKALNACSAILLLLHSCC
jgi:hypothetical protein